MFLVIAAIPCMLGGATKYCQILYFATCFCFVLALLLLALSFSFLIALLTNFSSGVSNALKALDRAFSNVLSTGHRYFVRRVNKTKCC